MSIIRKSTFDASAKRLRAKFSDPVAGEIAVAAFSEGWTVLPDDNPAFDWYTDVVDTTAAMARQADAGQTERLDRKAAIRERASNLIASGQSIEDAERNATRAVAYERGEVDIDNMTIAERDAHLRTGFDPSVMGIQFADDAPVIDEQQAADMAALWEAQKPSYIFPEGGAAVDERMQAAEEARRTEATRVQAVETTYRAIRSSNPDLDDALIRSMAETAIGPAKVAVAKPTGLEGLVDTPELRAALGMPQKDPA